MLHVAPATYNCNAKRCLAPVRKKMTPVLQKSNINFTELVL